MNLQQLIGRWVEESGLRVEALSERVGVSRQTIYKWTNGESCPTLENLDRLVDALGKNAREKRAAIDALLEVKRSA